MTIDLEVDATRQPDGGDDDDALLVIENLTVSFPTDDGLVNAVRGVSYTVRSGEAMGIVGESGSGKSVSSLAVMGLLPKNARITGSVRFRGREMLGLREDEYSKIRGNRIAMIFQDPLTSLNPVYTIGFQISEAVLAHNNVSKAEARKRSIELLSVVGIPFPEQRVDSFPHELSGGMRQRVVIAIAMANNPDVIIADEPTTALDVTVQAQVLEALEAAREASGAALILITHDLGVIAGHAERINVMYAGKLVETGTTEDVFYRPRMPYTLGLLGSLPRMDQERQERLTPIKGSPPSLLNLPPGCPFTPRCPLAADICDREEPDLIEVHGGGGTPSADQGQQITGGPRTRYRTIHAAACHFRDRTADAEAADLFGDEPTGRPAPDTGYVAAHGTGAEEVSSP